MAAALTPRNDIEPVERRIYGAGLVEKFSLLPVFGPHTAAFPENEPQHPALRIFRLKTANLLTRGRAHIFEGERGAGRVSHTSRNITRTASAKEEHRKGGKEPKQEVSLKKGTGGGDSERRDEGEQKQGVQKLGARGKGQGGLITGTLYIDTQT